MLKASGAQGGAGQGAFGTAVICVRGMFSKEALNKQDYKPMRRFFAPQGENSQEYRRYFKKLQRSQGGKYIGGLCEHICSELP